MADVIAALRGLGKGWWCSLGSYRELYDGALARLAELQAGRRIWGRDGSLWASDPVVAEEIEERLGWLGLPTSMQIDVARLRALGFEAQAAGIERVVLLGMGGSSLAPEVLQRTLGAAPDYAQLVVLDSTDPAQIRRVAEGGEIEKTLFIAASKSGTTLETLSLMAYFRERLQARVGVSWPKHLIAITDPGTRLYTLGIEQGFRAVYGNPPDIGGRYSALSLFGLVPAALMGIDLDKLLASAKEMAWRCRAEAPVAENPGMILGAMMGGLMGAQPSRDKLTLLASSELSPLGPWIEQLVAESTGKEGAGILPVEGEPLAEAGSYGRDRLFAYLRLDGADNQGLDAFVGELAALGHPIVALGLDDLYSLGAEFFRWEYATAVAGILMDINPFDQPNVELAKARASAMLSQYHQKGAWAEGEPIVALDGMRVYGPSLPTADLGEYLNAYWRTARAGDYVSIMAYVDHNPDIEDRLQTLRAYGGRLSGAATTLGYGPRFLHSTGQYHKGGPDRGLFIQITQEEASDLPIPGQEHSFGVLKSAQAAGDLMALQEMGRRVVRIHLGADVLHALDALLSSIEAAASGC